MKEETILFWWKVASACCGIIGVVFIACQRTPAEQKASLIWRFAAYMTFFIGFSALGGLAIAVPFYILHLIFKT